MKKLLFYSLALAPVLFLSADSTNALDKKNGFKNYKLGTPVSLYSATPLGGKGCSRSYSIKPGPSDNVGSVEMKKITLWTTNDTVTKIVVGFDNQAAKLISVFTQAYGQPVISDIGTSKNYSWKGENVRMTLLDDYINSSADDSFTIWSKNTEQLEKRCEDREIKSAVDSL